MEVTLGYKQTEVGVIPEEWEVHPITKVTHAIFLGLTSKVDYVSNGGIPLIRATDIAGGRLSFLEARTISVRQHRELTKYRRPKRGNVLVSKSGSLGVCAIVDVDFEFSIYESIIVLQPTERLDSSFLLSLLRDEATQTRMIGEKVGSTVGHLNLEMFRRLVLAIPSLTEQRAIAVALSDVDTLLGTLDRLIAKKRDLKQAAMQQLLTGQVRLPGFQGEWEVKRIGDITECTAGGTPSTLEPSYWGGSIRWMSSGELNLKLVNEVAGRITEEGLRNSSTKMIPPKCVLIGLAGQGKTRGTVAINLVELCTNQSIAAVFPSGAFVSEYLYYNLDARYDELRDLSSGDGGRGGLNLAIINAIRVPLPSIPEQTAIAEVLSDMDVELATLEQRREKTRALKQGMMQELLTGKTRLV